jgi:endoglucanase
MKPVSRLYFLMTIFLFTFISCSKPEARLRSTPRLLPEGYLHTNGSQIVGPDDNPVRICSVGWGWYGGTPWGLNRFNYRNAFRALVDSGINCVRICTDDAQVLKNPDIGIDSTVNADLSGLTYNQMLQAVVSYGAGIGLKFVIESHLSENNSQFPSNGNGLWYDVGDASDNTDGNGQAGTITSEMFLQSWMIRADLFKNNPAVIGYDLRNEPHFGPATWGSNDPETDYRLLYEQVGNALLALDPGPMIICEGLQAYGHGAPSGDLRKSTIGNALVRLSKPDKLVYSVHEYPDEVSSSGLDHGPEYIDYMNTVWGWLYKENIAPVWVGECGDNMHTPAGQAWADTFIDYVNGKDGGSGGPVFTGDQQGVSWSWWDFGIVHTNEVPQFGILNSSADGVDEQQQEYWGQMLGK